MAVFFLVKSRMQEPKEAKKLKYANDALDDYLQFLRVERQLAANTLMSYERDLKIYLQYLKEVEQLESLRNVERIHILNHLSHLKEATMSSRTVARHISSIRSFHQFLIRERVVDRDPTVHL